MTGVMSAVTRPGRDTDRAGSSGTENKRLESRIANKVKKLSRLSNLTN